MAVNSRTTASPMSTDSSRSSSTGGSGTIISRTIATIAPGTSSRAVRNVLEVCDLLMAGCRDGRRPSEHQPLEPHEVRQHLGHGAEQVGGNRVADFGMLVQGACQCDVLHD